MNHFGGRARHTILATNKDYRCQSRIKDDIDFKIADIGDADQGNILRRVRNYSRFLQDMQPDLLLTYHWGAIEWALANSFSPHIRHFHLESGFGPEEAHGTLWRRDIFRRFSLRRIDGLVVPSMTLVNLSQDRWHIPESKIRYIPNGVDCNKYAAPPQQDIIPGFTRGPDDVVIGTMTPLRPEKNLPRLIRAFVAVNAKIPAARLIIMGEGGERAKLETLIRESGCAEHIFLPGHIEEPAFALGLLDIYAISSDTEQMPNSLNQAMAASLPIVGLDVGDIKHIMSDLNKDFIVPAGDDDAFTASLETLVREKSRRQEIGAVNVEHVRKTYDQSRMFDGYADVWGLA